MEGSVFAKSIELMVVGMGMTFAFLIILVCIMKVLQFVVENFLNKVFPPASQAAAAAPAVSDDKIKIAIALAAAKSMAK